MSKIKVGPLIYLTQLKITVKTITLE